MKFSTNSINTVFDPKTTKKKYQESRKIILDDNFNSFEHVAICLIKIIPEMSKKKSWELTVAVEREGMAEVWRAPIEQAELIMSKCSMKG